MQTFQLLFLLGVFIPLAIAGLSGGGGGWQKHHKSNQHIQIKGGIGDGFIYPAKSRHPRKGGSGGHKAQTYKLIIQNGGSQGGHAAQHATQQTQQHVKTFKVIQQSAPAPAATAHGGSSVKTIKLIHVNGGSGSGTGDGCPSGGHGWQ